MGKNRVDLSADIDIGQLVSRRIAEAFKYGIDCDIIQGGLLPNRPEQGLYEVSDVQNYLIGTRRVGKDGRVFRYAHAGFLLDSSAGCWSSDYQALAQWAKFPRNYKAGVMEISVTTVADVAGKGVDGVAFDGKFAKDVLQGGYIVLFQTGIQATTQLIAGNTALDAPGELFIQLAHPLRSPITAGAGSAEAIFSPYRDVVGLGGLDAGNIGHYVPIVGIPLCNAKVGEYSWILTWGPTHCTTSDTDIGSGDSFDVRFSPTNGMLVSNSDDNRKLQYAGFTLGQDWNGGSPQPGSPFIMLQISP